MFAILRYAQEEFEDNKGVIKIRKSKKNRQHNDQKKTNKRTINDLVNQFFKSDKYRCTLVRLLLTCVTSSTSI